MVIGDRKEEGLVVLWLVVEFKEATESQPLGCEGRRHGSTGTFPFNQSLPKFAFSLNVLGSLTLSLFPL